MSIHRTPKDQDHPFTQSSNSFIYDCRLSLRSKALLLFVLSKPPTWVFNFRDVLRFNLDGIKSIRNSMKELSSLGYLFFHQSHRPNGDFEYSQYMFFETSKNLNTAKTVIPACSPLGHTLKGHTLKAHTLFGNSSNNKYKIKLIKETTTSSTKVVNTNVVDVSPEFLKKKEECFNLCMSLGVINPNHIIDKYGLNGVFAAALILKDYPKKVDNPTAFIVVGIKEKWKENKPPPEKPKPIRQDGKCLSCTETFYYMDFKPTQKYCPECRGKKV
ncbi:hypothetical protein ES705_30575 [subsurface metagenome]